MFRPDALEAAPIVASTLNALLTWSPTRGRPGADLRTAVGDVKAHVLRYLQTDTIGPPLAKCFDLAVNVGISLPELMEVREVAWEPYPITVGAIVIQDALVELCLSSAGVVLANTTFVSRQDVDKIKDRMNAVFVEIEEEIADQLDSMTYRAIIKLHAAVTAHLVETARPLPQMLRFRFGMPQPTLVMAHKLYTDAGRADELLRENKVVHPAFALPSGRALSA